MTEADLVPYAEALLVIVLFIGSAVPFAGLAAFAVATGVW